MSKNIRVDEDTHAALTALKRDDETFDDLLSRFIEDRRDAIKDGAGLWVESDAVEHAREKRREMKDGIGPQ